jgi:hypothetical protein
MIARPRNALKTTTLAAVGAVALCFGWSVQPARAEVDQKCHNEWHMALMTQQIGQKCGYLDAAAADKLKKAQAARMQCAHAKATSEEKTWLDGSMRDGQTRAATQVAGMQCTPDVRKAYDANLAALAAASAAR